MTEGVSVGSFKNVTERARVEGPFGPRGWTCTHANNTWSAFGRSIGTRTRRRKPGDRKSTRLNSSHLGISYAVFCLKKKQTLGAFPPRACCGYHYSPAVPSDRTT